MTTQKPDFTRGIASEAVIADRPLLGTVEGRDVVLIRHAGQLSALSASCTHLGASLDEGLVAEGQIRCPWHHARFSLADGTAEGGPAVVPLSCYPVEEADGQITVSPKRQAAAPKAPKEARERIVIIGTGAAGYAVAAALGRGGHAAEITLIGAEPDRPYDRTYCSKQYLAGEKSRKDAMLPNLPGDPITKRDTTITGIDREKRQVETSSGGQISYDRLILATGAAPIRPDFPGSDKGHLLRSLADADRLIAAAVGARSVVVLGASFIGLEAAAAMQARGLRVTVIATDEVPLEKILGAEAGRFIQRLHQEKGVGFVLGTSVESFDGKAVTTKAGETIAADLLILGTGVKPCSDLAREAGLTLAEDDGISVDESLRTSDPAIWAIGDVASYPDPLTGKPLRIEHWVHAERQGEHLAADILSGQATAFTAAPFFWSGHYGTQLRYVGHATPKDVEIRGRIEDADFEVHYRHGAQSAVLTCGRDMVALEAERASEEAVG